MKRQILLALFCAVLFFSQSYAATIRVPQDQPTIQAGVSAAGMSDTILVAPGTYEESIAIGPVPVCLTSQIGAAQTTIIGRVEIVGNSQGLVELSGFTIKETSGSNIVTVRDSWSAILDNVFENNSGWSTVVLCDNSSLLIKRNLFHHNNVGSACVGVVSGTAKIINNTFDSNTRGFFSLVEGTIALNNIVTRSTEYGVYGPYSRLDYNDVWSNGSNYEDVLPGANDISSDPLFSHANLGDYSLLEGSPCIDGGAPDPEYRDPDETRNDMGAFYRMAMIPLARQIRVGSAINQRVPEALPEISWTFLDSNNSVQHSFELQIGTDRDWSTAELLSSGEVISVSTTLTYTGPPLTEGSSYVGRLRVSNETRWGGWIQFDFRLNQTPNPLTAVFPLTGDTLSPSGVWLQVRNGFDRDNDSLSYIFEVYSDAELTQLVSTQGDLESRDSITYSQLISSIEPGDHYWWRARATDGYEFSDWTAPGHFVARSPRLIHVPQDQPTIQLALDLAGDGDTVLVAPGEYHEFIWFPGHAVKLISAEGPGVTRLARPAGSGTEGYNLNFLYPVSREAEVDGFTMSGEHAYGFVVLGYGAQPILKNNVFRDLICETAIILTDQGNPLIANNLFVNNVVGWYCVEALGPVDIFNNTFDHNSRGIYSQNGAATLLNNIIANATEFGVHGSFRVHDYNDVFNNHPNYQDAIASANEIALDPQFLDPANGDYSLRPTSPCIDAGDPRPEFADLDGTRNDLGAISFHQVSPIAYSISVGDNGNLHVVDQSPLITWQYFDDLNRPQVRFEIEIGTDHDWAVAELWDSGEIDSGSPFATYAGNQLIPGLICFGRIRVNNGQNWSSWQDFTIRKNSPPAVPQPVDPVNGVLVPRFDTRLRVQPALDGEQDSVRYEFAVYADAGMTQNIFSVSGNTDPITSLVPGLVVDQTYWWRARASDKFEFSNWSPLASFVTRGGISLQVPQSFNTIQAAIDAAHHGDTILVAPGSYTGFLDLHSKALFVVSSHGPYVTSLAPNESGLIKFESSDVDAPMGISGFTVRDYVGQSVIHVYGGLRPLIANLRFLNNRGNVLIEIHDGSPTIEHNLFSGNVVNSACIGVAGGSPTISNNTIFGNSRGIYSFSSGTVVRNNIIAASIDYGLYGRYKVIDYNDVWHNYPDYDLFASTVTNSIAAYPQFRDFLNEDFRLSFGSPCLNAGNPAATYNDPDGSRNDLGAYPFVQQHPAPFQLLTPGNSVSPALLTMTPTFVWSSAAIPNALGTMTYALQIATDSLFSFASLVEGVDTTATLPAPLTWGTRYWWKVKASIAGEGETWSNEVFTFRTLKLGDADGSGRLNITDIVFLINYIFVGGRPPVPLVAGDMNCSGRINIADAVFLVNYLFGDGPQPCSDFPTTAPAFGPDEAAANR